MFVCFFYLGCLDLGLWFVPFERGYSDPDMQISSELSMFRTPVEEEKWGVKKMTTFVFMFSFTSICTVLEMGGVMAGPHN